MEFYRITGFMLAAVALFSCSKANVRGGADAEGFVKFTTVNDWSVVETTKSAVSDYTTLPSKNDFIITVKNSDGTEIYKGLISDYHKLSAGSYTVSASYGSEGVEGFDKAYFTGSTAFSVIGGDTKAVSIPTSLGNSIVKVAVTEMFKNYFPTYSFNVETGSGARIAFPSTETRGAFVDAYKLTVSGEAVKASGTKIQIPSKDFHDLQPATCYTITFGVTNVGGAKLTISFNDMVETVDLGDVELN